MTKAKEDKAKTKVADAEYDYVVMEGKQFRDIYDVQKGVTAPKIYNAGDNVSDFEQDRLTDLVNRKLVERRVKA
ncbi:hypothetical protein I2I11_04175 [Pontibacter sp. 172403-2]|uniref:hypothetical protein n=1 Tax=Pontibacter rufus TaxID=2791028 RepID=UPI0018AFB500|nr:hypothetical protein [Pontibacter sp. 172403-2]MBF9252481.1 hypothetical protein [Pontibacter sp. 172403-2]